MRAPSTARPLIDQVALVTGASSDLGRATARALAQAGADVGMIGRSETELDQVAGEITAIGQRVLTMPLDLADESQVLTTITQFLDRFGRVDILVNAAGTDIPGSVEELQPGDWDHVLDVNLRAPFLLAKAVFPSMRAAGHGTIVNVSSVAGKRGWAKASAYCASKFGLTGLTQAIAAEGKPHGIRACILYPGGMDTNWGSWSTAERHAKPREPRSSTKALPPEDVAALIVWIATAPSALVLNEVIISPLDEDGWP